LYEHRRRVLEFNARSLDEWKEWRRRLRRKLIELLGGLDYPRRSLSPKVTDEWERDGYTIMRVEFWSDEFNLVPAFLLKPKSSNGAAVLTLHGHGYGKGEITGFDENGKFREVGKGYQKDFAISLVKRGFTVLAIDQSGFGERREDEDIKEGAGKSSCWWLAIWAFMYGETVIGRRVWDAMRAIDYLQSLEWIGPNRIGVMGISGGGTTTLFTSALDDRVKATVVSGYFNTFRDSILLINHCIDNYVPGLLNYAEMYDIAALIAPRPLLIESGLNDPIFPIRGVKYAFERLKKAYELLGALDKLELDAFEGGHKIYGVKAYDFLLKWL